MREWGDEARNEPQCSPVATYDTVENETFYKLFEQSDGWLLLLSILLYFHSVFVVKGFGDGLIRCVLRHMFVGRSRIDTLWGG